MSTEITATRIKELRDRTGVGMAKCKAALVAANGDLEQAIVDLRKAGLATVAKKEGRSTNEGSISFAENDERVAIIEVNAETDFVVNNEIFQGFIKMLAEEAAKTNPASVEDFGQQKLSTDGNLSVDEYRAGVIQKIGENIQIRRIKTFEKNSSHSVGVYSHMGGKIVTVVELNGSSEDQELARDIAMHVAATKPEYVSADQVPEAVKTQEREIAQEQLKGKPENIMEKILEGKFKAYCEQHCLVCQKFVRDDKITIGDLVQKHAKEAGKEMALAAFDYWKVGG